MGLVRNTLRRHGPWGEDDFGPRRGRARRAGAGVARLGRAATFVAVLTSPATFRGSTGHDWPLPWALLATVALVIAFRGFVDVLAHRLIPRASLYGAGRELIDGRHRRARRVWYWRTKFRRLFWIVLVVGGALALLYVAGRHAGRRRGRDPALPIYFLSFGLQLPLFFLINLLILFGPLLFFGLQADEGLRAGRRRLGREARGRPRPGGAEGRRSRSVIELWSAGEEFRKAGGKPERGLLFIGAPGHRQDDALQGRSRRRSTRRS